MVYQEEMADNSDMIDKMNLWAGKGVPFFFLTDFELSNPVILKLDEIDPEKLLYNINGITNCKEILRPDSGLIMTKHPEGLDKYQPKFRQVMKEIEAGNTYLLNLTCSTPVEINLTLKEIFMIARSKYRIWYDDQFVCFSPEKFITISNGIINSFPMKGTIDAEIPDAEKIILGDFKETAEHNTIVDLIRNDLSMVSEHVRVERFRYTEIIETPGKTLLQVSSEIRGNMSSDYLSRLGDIVFKLLPAGSVSGAPKKKTTGIIAKVEGRRRGYYTGITGLFDGYNLDTGVMIRFIEKRQGHYFYRSGGGITAFSDAEAEYREMTDKIYVPVI